MNIQEYSVAAITIKGTTNPSTIAKEIGVHQTTTSRFLDKISPDDINLMLMVKNLFGKKPLTLIVDEVTVDRRYSQETEGTSSMVDPSTKTFTNGYKVVVMGLTDGKYFLPLDCEQWIAEAIMKDAYRKVTDIAKILIKKVLDLGLNIRNCVMDGLYSSIEFVLWLNELGANFTMKIKTTTSVLFNGEKMQLKNCKALQLNGNQTAKTIIAEWAGKMWYFTAVLRAGKRGPKLIYLISNFEAKSKKYKKLYNSRWIIEKFFRTTKQSLGLKNSSSRFAHIYLAHIKCVFFAYTILQLLMKKFKLNSTEEAIRKTQDLKNKWGFRKTVDWVNLSIVNA